VLVTHADDEVSCARCSPGAPLALVVADERARPLPPQHVRARKGGEVCA